MIRVGIGGWVFAPWRGVFYPKGLPQARELEFASRKLTTIERGLGMLPLDQQRLFRACGGASARRTRRGSPDRRAGDRSPLRWRALRGHHGPPYAPSLSGCRTCRSRSSGCSWLRPPLIALPSADDASTSLGRRLLHCGVNPASSVSFPSFGGWRASMIGRGADDGERSPE